MDQILEWCKGVIGIVDDVIIQGCDDEEYYQSLHTHAGCQRTWTYLQWWEMHHKAAINQISWLDLWQGGCTPRFFQGHHHSQHAGPRDTLSTAGVPWHGHIPVSLHALSLLLYSTPPWPAVEGCWVHLEWNIPRCPWLHQESSMFQHHLPLLWCLQASHYPSWCL